MILLCTATAAIANPFPDGDALAGKLLFEKHHCSKCHIRIVGGDGNKVFTRQNRKIRTAAALLEQIGICGANVGVTFTPQEKQHLGAYLNRFYNLK